jgi:protein-S-isoprenylcysteine O-methyltransferase Ste14
MKTRNSKEWARTIAARGGIIAFFIMAFEVMIMISPFAFFFYSVFNPVFHWLGAYPATRWLTHFFLPHMILPPTHPLKVIRIAGSVLFLAGSATFLVCALQVYLGKILKRGIACRGIYRLIRHPQYTALSAWGLGMAILWPRFIVLASLSVMFILYYFLARDEESRMISLHGESYRQYMRRTGMFLPLMGRAGNTVSAPCLRVRPRSVFGLAFVVALVIGAGFLCRAVTLDSLELMSGGNVTLVPIMPEDNVRQPEILKTISHGGIDFLNGDKDYLAYDMPVDYVMQGMIANTGAEHHLFKQHHTVALISDWVLHPFAHLRRSPSVQMAKMMNVDPAMARRHHCPLGLNDPNMDCSTCDYRRVIFVEVDNPSNRHMSGKALFAFDTRRVPIGFIDLNTKTGGIVNMQRVDSKTAWSDVPTPAI